MTRDSSYGAGVHPATADALAARGITALFPIQAEVVPHADQGADILARSPTGSGKTLAFGIPLIQALHPDDTGVQALVLVPTRELALQVADELRTLTTGFEVATVFGGVKQGAQVRALKTASVVVACPGRLEDLMQQGEVTLDGVHTLVLDEADRMLDMGFSPIVERILAKVPRDRQTMLFSATLDERIHAIASRHTEDPVIVSTAPPQARPTTIEHAFIPATHEGRMELLCEVLDAEAGDRDLTVVFSRTKHGASRMAKRMAKRGYKTAALHGDLAQGARQRELGRFERGEADVLIATDVFARGLDLDRITHVINMDPPGETEDYVHRAGRTGRAGRSGLVITFVNADLRADVQKIADELGLREEFTRNGLEHIERGKPGPGVNGGRKKRRNRGGSRPRANA